MKGTTQNILSYAMQNNPFCINNLLQSFPHEEVSERSIICTISRLVESGKLTRIARGVYSIPSEHKNDFNVVLGEMETRVSGLLKEKLPFATFCIYNGQTLAPLQHHLSFNNITYVETERYVMESVFNILHENGITVYLNPKENFVSLYIDLKQPAVIVKPMVSESPVKQKDGITIPTLEKLLVDIRKDSDFGYLQGMEAEYMLENAQIIYSINNSRLRRYARRRHLDIPLDKIK